jgi:hypothetical protein
MGGGGNGLSRRTMQQKRREEAGRVADAGEGIWGGERLEGPFERVEVEVGLPPSRGVRPACSVSQQGPTAREGRRCGWANGVRSVSNQSQIAGAQRGKESGRGDDRTTSRGSERIGIGGRQWVVGW